MKGSIQEQRDRDGLIAVDALLLPYSFRHPEQ
jgi:hypothetical protein